MAASTSRWDVGDRADGARTTFTAESPLTWMVSALVLLVLVGRDLGWRERRLAHADGADPAEQWWRSDEQE